MTSLDERFGSLLAKAAISKGPCRVVKKIILHASNSRQEEICLILILTCLKFLVYFVYYF